MEKRFSVARMYSGEPEAKSQPVKMTAPGKSAAPQMASGAKMIKSKTDAQTAKGQIRDLSQDAQSVLNLPKRENFNDFKAKVKSFLK